MSKILVLTGSPRKNGNSDKLADAFIEGAQNVGNSVIKCGTAFKNVKGCYACNKCFTDGKPCFIDKKFNEIAPDIHEADVLVLSTPLYWFSFPAQLKAVIDKLYCFVQAGVQIQPKKCVLMVCAGDTDEVIFEGIKKSYESIVEYLKWENIGIILVPGVYEPDDILKTRALKEARELGASIS